MCHYIYAQVLCQLFHFILKNPSNRLFCDFLESVCSFIHYYNSRPVVATCKLLQTWISQASVVRLLCLQTQRHQGTEVTATPHSWCRKPGCGRGELFPVSAES